MGGSRLALQGNLSALTLSSRDFKIEDGRAVIPLGTTVQGDVLIVIYHARSTLGGRLQAKVSSWAGRLAGPPWLSAMFPRPRLLCKRQVSPPPDGRLRGGLGAPTPTPRGLLSESRHPTVVCPRLPELGDCFSV